MRLWNQHQTSFPDYGSQLWGYLQGKKWIMRTVPEFPGLIDKYQIFLTQIILTYLFNMKRLFFLFLFFTSTISTICFAQDEVIFHNGNIAKGKVSEVTDLNIKFTYEGEDVINIIGRCAISEVRFASGRVQQMSQKIYVNSEEDWEKVRVVYDKNEIYGLKSLGQIEKHSSGTWSFSITAGHFEEKTLKKIRKEAAKRGGCIVLVLYQQSNSGGAFKNGNASMTGEIYTY